MLASTPLLVALALAAPQEPAAPPPATAAVDVSPAVRATNELGIALFKALDQEQPGKNLFLSPFSIAIALAMLTEGASDETAAELRAALHLDTNTPLDGLHAGFQELRARYREGAGNADPDMQQRIAALRDQLATATADAERLRRSGDWEQANAPAARARDLARQINQLLPQVDRYDLRVANALWFERTHQLAPAFTKTLDRCYGGDGVNSLDILGNPEAARVRINGWVEEHTERHIKDLIPPGGIDVATALVISNAVFFRGEWAEPFAERRTLEADFWCAGGARTLAKQMCHYAHMAPYAAFTGDGGAFATPIEVPADPKAKQPPTYPDDDGFTMIELPYKGGELAMLVIAPRTANGLTRVERLLTGASLATWVEHLQRRTVDTRMLRFEQRGTFDLSRALRTAGMSRAFVTGGAQFGGIAADRDAARGLFVTGVHHQAWLQVHEKGTEAAAASALVMTGGAEGPALMVPFTPVFRADRPFLFLIRDVKSGAILFLGRVTDPRG